MSEAELRADFKDVERVIADTLRFKARLKIGDDAYRMLKTGKMLGDLWDVGGVAATGAAAAASPVVATTFFASTGGLLGLLGLGTAATPIGWVIAAAVASGGAYYGVIRLFRGQQGELVDKIPRFISTPIDLLGTQLFDLMGALALKVALIDGHFDDSERTVIVRHFIDDWGYDAKYVERALDVLEAQAAKTSVKALAQSLAAFQAANPDCNAEAMQTQLISFLRDIEAADGVLDEREALAIDAIEATFREQRRAFLSNAGKALNSIGDRTGNAVRQLASKVGLGGLRTADAWDGGGWATTLYARRDSPSPLPSPTRGEGVTPTPHSDPRPPPPRAVPPTSPSSRSPCSPSHRHRRSPVIAPAGPSALPWVR